MFVGVARQIAARRSSSNQLFAVAVEQAHDQRAKFVAVKDGGRLTETDQRRQPPKPS